MSAFTFWEDLALRARLNRSDLTGAGKSQVSGSSHCALETQPITALYFTLAVARLASLAPAAGSGVVLCALGGYMMR